MAEINDTINKIEIPEINDAEINNNNKVNYMVEWYKKNKDKHLQTMKNKTMCACGIMVSYGNKNRHITTPKHLKKISNQNNQN